ncbi:hypothetical protein DTO166G4_8560 [Paecilomyces variotii]|nr:hypothetical protein DTO166G4_8560 [Paecilomyces variotii]KAJ9229088.1 hypothetical protein DTO166G5_8170 [Paecilomyces variotii]KAJ9243753.1 hypothetical protein DTO169E5_2382 [Paecilomyces variotii]
MPSTDAPQTAHRRNPNRACVFGTDRSVHQSRTVCVCHYSSLLRTMDRPEGNKSNDASDHRWGPGPTDTLEGYENPPWSDRDPFTTASYYGCSLAVLVQYKYSGPFRTIRILN